MLTPRGAPKEIFSGSANYETQSAVSIDVWEYILRLLGSALLSALIVTGCALPPAVTVASVVSGGVSYVATGKSTTDHAISAVVRQDCALLRVVQDQAICDPNGEVLIGLVGNELSEENWAVHGDVQLQDNGPSTDYGSAKEIEAPRLPP